MTILYVQPREADIRKPGLGSLQVGDKYSVGIRRHRSDANTRGQHRHLPMLGDVDAPLSASDLTAHHLPPCQYLSPTVVL